MQIPDRDEPFHHIDRNTLHRVAPPGLNPLAVEAGLGRAPWRRPQPRPRIAAASRSWSASAGRSDAPSISRSGSRGSSLRRSGVVPRPAA